MFSNHPRVRVAVYLVAVASQVAAFFVRLYSPELGEAFSSTANLLAAVAGVTALSNITPDVRENGLGGTAPDVE